MITLRTMTDGLPHPNARQHVIGYKLDASFACYEWYDEMHINGSRLGVVFRPTDPEDNRFSVAVWNWTTGEMVLVRGSYRNATARLTPLTLSSSASRMTVAKPFSSWTNTGF